MPQKNKDYKKCVDIKKDLDTTPADTSAKPAPPIPDSDLVSARASLADTVEQFEGLAWAYEEQEKEQAKEGEFNKAAKAHQVR